MDSKIIISTKKPIRADLYFTNLLNISRSKVAFLLENGTYTLNGKLLRKKDVLKDGDVVEVTKHVIFQEETIIKPQNIDINIIFEDEYLAVVEKPKGMNIHIDDKHKEGTLVNAILHRFSDLAGSDEKRKGVVHRLDKNTSGLVLIAKKDNVLEALKESFKKREIEKIYLALTRGVLENQKIINAPIGRNKKDRTKRTVNGLNPKEAITICNMLTTKNNFSLVSCKILTGRTHQIRVHLSYINCPIYCDNVYGTKEDRKNKEGQYLHAYKLSFVHPVTKIYYSFSCPLPDYFLSKLSSIGFSINDLGLDS